MLCLDFKFETENGTERIFDMIANNEVFSDNYQYQNGYLLSKNDCSFWRKCFKNLLETFLNNPNDYRLATITDVKKVLTVTDEISKIVTEKYTVQTDIKTYISSLDELHGDKIKLVSDDDPEAQLILADYYVDKEVREFTAAGSIANIVTKKDALAVQGLNEKGEKLFKNSVPGYKMFIVKNSENKPIGKFWMTYFEKLKLVSLGCWFGKPHWGNGYAFDTITTILRKFQEDKIKVPVRMSIEPSNPKSLRACEKGIQKFGFKDFKMEENSENIFYMPNYTLKQNFFTVEYEYKIDDEVPNQVIISTYVDGEKLRDDYKKEKNQIRPEILENKHRKVTYLQFLLTPIY